METGDLARWSGALQGELGWLPAWAFSLLLLGVGLMVALAIHAAGVVTVRRALARAPARHGEFWRPLIVRTQGPGRLALIILFFGLAASVAPLDKAVADLIRHGLLIAFIVLIGWTVLTAMEIASALYMRRYKVDVEDNLLARKHLTQVRILRRALAIVVVILTCAFALMTISGVRQWGVSLLAAGGAAGIILGLALQPLLTNLIAGVQIAVTQPIRIDDAVIIEGEFGKIEEISGTYVVVRLWDWRRMIVPLSWFLEKPFQNWTRESASLIGSAFLYLDYSAPVDRLRAKLDEIVRASPLWDGDVISLAVTDLRERVMEIRCLASARNSGDAFDLRCEVREKMMAFLQAELPGALPRDRFDIRSPAPDAPVLSRRADADHREVRPS